jgi:hypothetical protein
MRKFVRGETPLIQVIRLFVCLYVCLYIYLFVCLPFSFTSAAPVRAEGDDEVHDGRQ